MDHYLLALDLTSPKAWLVIGSACGTFLAIAGVLALVWAFVKPWLIAQLVEPLHETRRQVTVNGHSSSTPTVLDLLSELRAGQASLSDDFCDLRTDLSDHVRTATRRFDRQQEQLDELRTHTPSEES